MGTAERLNPHARRTEVQLPTDIMDRFGRTIAPGDTVAVQGLPSDDLYDVEEVSPNLDPKQPPNTVRLALVRRALVVLPAHQAMGQFLRVRTAKEAGRPEVKPTLTEIVPPPARSWWQRLLDRFLSH